ncbi:MAG: hypothetical protein ACRDGD_09825 [Candidatus Limnocylindria bacterium]
MRTNHRDPRAFEGLPGYELVREGLEDLARSDRLTIAGLVVAIGAPRLSRIGLEIPADLPDNPEHRLYQLLSADDTDAAHGRYNALIRRLVSFERAAEHATTR